MGVELTLGVAGASVLLLLLCVKVLSTPLKLALRAVLNTLLGLGALLLVNATTSITGLSLGINLFNALTVGVLGVPGLGLLFLLQWVFT